MWWTMMTSAWASAPAFQVGVGLPLPSKGPANVQLSGRYVRDWAAAELNLSLDPYPDARPSDFDGFGGLHLDQDWAVKGWIDLSPPAPGRSGFEVAPHAYLGLLRWRGQWVPSGSRGRTGGAFDPNGAWSWAPAAGVGAHVAYQRVALRGRVELSARSAQGERVLHQAACIDLLVSL